MTLAFHLALGTCGVLMVLLGFALRRVSYWKCYQHTDYWTQRGRAGQAELNLDCARSEIATHKRTIDDLERALAKTQDALRDRDEQIVNLKSPLGGAIHGAFRYDLGPGPITSSCTPTMLMGHYRHTK